MNGRNDRSNRQHVAEQFSSKTHLHRQSCNLAGTRLRFAFLFKSTDLWRAGSNALLLLQVGMVIPVCIETVRVLSFFSFLLSLFIMGLAIIIVLTTINCSSFEAHFCLRQPFLALMAKNSAGVPLQN